MRIAIHLLSRWIINNDTKMTLNYEFTFSSMLKSKASILKT